MIIQVNEKQYNVKVIEDNKKVIVGESVKPISVLTVGVPGMQGPPGPQGPKGDQGDLTLAQLQDGTRVLIPLKITIDNITLEQSISVPGHLLVRSKDPNSPTRIHIEPNGYVDSGTVTKQDLMLDPYEDDQSNYRIFNQFTQSGDEWGRGWPGVAIINTKAVGNFYGAFVPMVFGFNDLGSTGQGVMKLMYIDNSDATIYTPHKGGWRPGLSVTTNDYIICASGEGSPNYVLYRATTTGTTGNTPLSHLSGTVSDGGVTWQYIKNYTSVAQAGNFLALALFGQRDDMPITGKTYTAQFARGAMLHNGQHVAHVNASGDVVGYRHNVGNDIYDVFSGGTHKMRYTSTFKQHQNGATLCATKTNTDGSTVLDASLCETLLLSNTNPTTITTVSSTIHQFFFVRATNGNTTLQHSSSLVLKGGANKLLASNEVLLFYATSNNAAVQV